MDIDIDTHLGRTPCEDRVPLQAKEHDRIPANHQGLERGKGVLYKFQKEHGAIDALILDFWPPEL